MLVFFNSNSAHASFCVSSKSYDLRIPTCSETSSENFNISCYTSNGFSTCNTVRFKSNQLFNSTTLVYVLNKTIFEETMDIESSYIRSGNVSTSQDMLISDPDNPDEIYMVNHSHTTIPNILINNIAMDMTLTSTTQNRISFDPFTSKPFFKEKFNNFRFFSDPVETLKRDVLVVVTFDQPNLIVNFPSSGDYSVWIDKSGFNEVFYMSNTTTLTLSTNFFINDLPITVYVYNLDVQIYTGTFEVSAATYCPYPINPFNSWSDTWQCMSAFGRFAIVCFWVGMVCFAIFGLFLSVLLIYYSMCLYRWLRAGPSIMVINKMGNANYENGYNSDGDDTSIEMTENQKKKKAKKNETISNLKKFQQGYYATLLSPAFLIKILVLALLVAPAMADLPPCNTTAYNTTYPELTCQYTFSIESTSFVCVAGSCSVIFNREITIGYPGQTSCINFLDKLGNIMTTLYVRYTGSKILTLFNYQYFTSLWSPVYQSDKSCPGAETFCTLSGCPAANTIGYNNSRNQVFNQYNNLALRAPMTSSCQASCGCASCGCFFCNSGCLWSYFGFLPINDTAGNPPLPVFTPGQTYNYPIVEGYFRNPEKQCWDSPFAPSFAFKNNITAPLVFSTADLSGSNILYKLSVVIKSQVLIEFPAWGNVCFFCPSNPAFLFTSPDGCKIGPCSPVNGPIAGLPGDIQFQTVNTSGFPQPPFRWLPTSVQTSFTDQFVNFIFPPRGWDTMMNYPTVGSGTVSYAGQKWVLQRFSYEADTIGQGPLTLGISSYEPFNVSYTDTSVCPTCTFNSITGCSTCPLGAIINITARSTCFAGAVTLSSTGPITLQTKSLVLKTTDDFYYINTFASVPSVAGLLNICDKDVCVTCSYSGYVPVYEEVTYGNYTPGKNDSSIVTTGDFSDWWFSLDGIWTWLKWVLAVIGGIVVIATLIASLVGIIILVMKFNNPYTPVKMFSKAA